MKQAVFSIKTQTAEIVACQIVGPYLTSSLRFGMFHLPWNEKKTTHASF